MIFLRNYPVPPSPRFSFLTSLPLFAHGSHSLRFCPCDPDDLPPSEYPVVAPSRFLVITSHPLFVHGRPSLRFLPTWPWWSPPSRLLASFLTTNPTPLYVHGSRSLRFSAHVTWIKSILEMNRQPLASFITNNLPPPPCACPAVLLTPHPPFKYGSLSLRFLLMWPKSRPS